MSACEAWDGDCPGCLCPSGRPPCTHCVEHLDEDGSPLVIRREDVTGDDDQVDPRKVFAHPAPLARDIPVWVRPYSPDSLRMQSMADVMAQLPDGALQVTVELWHRRIDYLTAPGWWHWRPPCHRCGDTSFRRRPHRWDCEQTPIWAQTVRDLDARSLTGDPRGAVYRGWNPTAEGWVQVGTLKDGDL